MREASQASEADVGLVGISGSIGLIRQCGLGYIYCRWNGIRLEAAIGAAIDKLNRVGREKDGKVGLMSHRHVMERRARQ